MHESHGLKGLQKSTLICFVIAGLLLPCAVIAQQGTFFNERDNQYLLLGLKRAKVSYEASKSEFERHQELFEQDLISETTLDRSEINFVEAEVNYQQQMLAKLVGSWLGLTIPLLIPILISMLLLMLFRVPMTATDWMKLVTLIAVSILYFTFSIALSLLVSALTRHSAVSFLLLLVAWITLVLDCAPGRGNGRWPACGCANGGGNRKPEGPLPLRSADRGASIEQPEISGNDGTGTGVVR